MAKRCVLLTEKLPEEANAYEESVAVTVTVTVTINGLVKLSATISAFKRRLNIWMDRYGH